jgi:hypothetical protein
MPTGVARQAGASFGFSVAGAGDLNRDGFDDVAVGAPEYDNGELDEGRAFVYFGASSGLGTLPWIAESDHTTGYFGVSVAGAGDVDGDGYDDLVVGSSGYSNGQAQEGRVYVYFGGSTFPDGAPWTVESNSANAYFGVSVAGAGDVDGDGYDDLILGAPLYDNGQLDEGSVFLYQGGPSGPGSLSWYEESDQIGAQFGWSVAGAGDLNRDGYDDVVIGARFFSNGQLYEGRAFVYYGGGAGLGSTPWTTESNQAAAWLGWSVAGAGDLNGDGYDDLVVGAPQYTDGASVEGQVQVFGGGPAGVGAASWTALSNTPIGTLGSAVAGAGDVDGDGHADLLAMSGSGGVGVRLYGGAPSWPNAVPDWTAPAAWGAGSSVAGAGDINGDGYDDVILGGNEAFWVQYGSCQGLVADPIDVDGDSVPSPADCDDCDPAVFPGAIEDDSTPDADEDCDGLNVTCGTVADIWTCSPELVITEVLTRPGIAHPVLGQWFEVQNRSLHAVDLKGSSTMTDAGMGSPLSQNLVLQPDEFAVFARSYDLFENGGLTPDALWTGSPVDPYLDTLVLLASDVTELDRVSYDASFSSGHTMPHGGSLSLDPIWTTAAGNDVPTHWCDARSGGVLGQDFRTPGAVNDSCTWNLYFDYQYDMGDLDPSDDPFGSQFFTFSTNDTERMFHTSNAGQSESVYLTTTPGVQTLEATYLGTGVTYVGTREPEVVDCFQNTSMVMAPPALAVSGVWTDLACP